MEPEAREVLTNDHDRQTQLDEARERTWHARVLWGNFEVNPVVFLTSNILIWAFVIACVVLPDYMLRGMSAAAFTWIPAYWTWLYIVSQDIWVVVLIYVMAVPRYGDLKFGKDDEPQDYSDLTWFSMLFSAGVATGLFYYAVAEPVWHQTGSNRWSEEGRGYGTNNERALHSMMVSWYHWGVHGWIPYTALGAVMSIMTYRRGFPMTTRYILWPLIGDKCYGVIGDLLDALSIITTIFGVCTSLGLGAIQINAGLTRFSSGSYRGATTLEPGEEPVIGKSIAVQCWLIVFVTILATCSVAVGLDKGIVNLSRFTFALGCFLMFTVLFLGETAFLLDLIVQTFGYYIWYLMKIGFWTDAFERLGNKEFGRGGAPDGLAGNAGWMSSWTIFYWGWWIAWSPFVGTFLARISKGRTLRAFILGTLIIPTVFTFLWFGILGGEGLRMQRIAETAGLCDTTFSAYAHVRSDDNKYVYSPGCAMDPDYRREGVGRCKDFRWRREISGANGECYTTVSWISLPCNQAEINEQFGAAGQTCGAVQQPTSDGSSSSSFEGYWTEGTKPFVTVEDLHCNVRVPDNAVCLSRLGADDMLFDMLGIYGGKTFTDVMCALTLVCLVLYFVTSSDSGSFVVDIISANGNMDPPLAQRIFWSCTEGATAMALLLAGRNLADQTASLVALQAASIVTGLPYTFVLCWCCQSLLLLVWEEAGELRLDRKAFNTFIFSVDRPQALLAAFFAPMIGIGKCVEAVGGWPGSETSGASFVWGAIMHLMYLAAIIMLVLSLVLDMSDNPIFAWGLSLWIAFGLLVGALRTQIREKYFIQHGDMITDIICGITVPWFTICQMTDQIANPGKLEALKGEAVEMKKFT